MSFLLPFFLIFIPIPIAAESVIVKDPKGFDGIEWGTPLAELSNVLMVERDDRMQTFQYKNGQSRFADVKVESLKLLTIDGQFGRVTVRYQSEQTHTHIMEYLETNFGKINLMPGSMVRGLNQEYTWRGIDTEVILHYRGLGERGFITIQSRTLAPRFLEITTSDTH